MFFIGTCWKILIILDLLLIIVYVTNGNSTIGNSMVPIKQISEETNSCRRIAYKLNDEKSGIHVRIQATWRKVRN